MSEGKVVKNTAYLLAAAVGQKVLALVYFMVVARLAGVSGTGQYVVATTFALIASAFADIGLANVAVREVARAKDKAEDYLNGVLAIKSVLIVSVAVISQIVAWLMNYSTDIRLMIAVATVAVLIDSLNVTYYAVLRGHQNLRFEAIGVISGQLILLVVGVTLFYFWREPVALVVGLLSNTSWNLFWSSRALVKHLVIRPRLVFNRDIIRFMWVTTLPFAAAGIFARLYSYIDSVMLSKFADEAAVGLYGSANKLTFAFIFLPASFAAALYPAMSEYFVEDRVRLARVYENAVKYLLLVVMPITFGIAVLSEPIIVLVYGKEFEAAAAPLRILIFALIFGFLYWPTGSLLNASNRQTLNTTALGVTVVANVSLNFYLLPRYGAIGAASTALATNALLFALSAAFMWGVVKLNAKRLFSPVFKTLFAASFMALSVTLLKPYLPLVGLMAAGAVVYVVVIIGVRGVTVAEARSMINLFLKRTGEREEI